MEWQNKYRANNWRYSINKLIFFIDIITILNKRIKFRSLRLSVRTHGFHPWKRGSIHLGTAKFMIEFTLFIFACLWSFFFIKLKKNFSQKTNIILTIFVIKISYITLISSIFFGVTNFGLKKTFISLLVTFLIIEILFFIGKKYLSNKSKLFDRIIKIKYYFVRIKLL